MKGFMALAHANYTCPPGRRYGADYYDERMKATRKLSVNSKDKGKWIENGDYRLIYVELIVPFEMDKTKK